eukprot:6784244-Prymnesium_polylepis.1
MQRAVRQLCKGYEMENGDDAPILFFADDASMISNSIAGLQLAFDCCWTVAKACGLQVKIKGKSKTAFTA